MRCIIKKPKPKKKSRRRGMSWREENITNTTRRQIFFSKFTSAFLVMMTS